LPEGWTQFFKTLTLNFLLHKTGTVDIQEGSVSNCEQLPHFITITYISENPLLEMKRILDLAYIMFFSFAWPLLLM